MKSTRTQIQEATKQAFDFYHKVIENQEANLFELSLVPGVAVLRFRARPVFYQAYATVPDEPIEYERLMSAVKAFYRITDDEARSYLDKKDMLFECDGVLIVNETEQAVHSSRTLTKSMLNQPDTQKNLKSWCQNVYESGLERLKEDNLI